MDDEDERGVVRKEFFGAEESAVEVKVKMIYDGDRGDIINQYVSFTRIYNEQIKEHGRTRAAVLETIRNCKEQNILREYLETREQEVVDIMMTLFDDEYIMKTYIESEKREAALETTQKAALKLYKKGTSVEDIAEVLSASVNEVKKWLGLAALQ